MGVIDNILKDQEKINYRNNGLKSDNIYSINKDSVYNLLFDSSSIKLSNNTFYTDKEIEIIEKDNILSIDEDSIPVLKEITIKFNTEKIRRFQLSHIWFK
mgnify:CR=1 FL=1